MHFRGDEQFARHLECCKRAEPAGLWRCTGSSHNPPNTAGELQQPAATTQSPGEIYIQDLGCWQHSIFLSSPVCLTVGLLVVQDYSSHSVMAADMNRGLPPMSTFHRNNTAARTPSINTSENSTGEEIISVACFSSGLTVCSSVLWWLCFFSSLREPGKRIRRVTDRRCLGQSSGLCKYAPPRSH